MTRIFTQCLCVLCVLIDEEFCLAPWRFQRSGTGVAPASRPCKSYNQHTGETPVPLPASSRRRLDKILEQLQTDPLAFFRMELRGEQVLLPHRRGEAFAVSGARRDDRWLNRFGKKAVHEINV